MKIIHLCPTKIKLTSLGMYTARKKDYCAEFNSVVKDGNRLRRNPNLPIGQPLHMSVCYMNENSCIKIFHAVSEQYRILRDFLDVDSCYKHLVTSLPNLGEAITTKKLDLGLGQGGG